MGKLLAALIITIQLGSCTDSHHKKVFTSRLSLPEHDKELRLRYEALQRLRTSGCIFLEPDTSISSIKIRDMRSADAILGNENRTDSLDQYHFYSRNRNEVLTLTQFAGDGANYISLFSVRPAVEKDYGYKALPVDVFTTEKGICLGLTKKDLTDRLGNCYAALDSTTNYIELYYRIEAPEDSRTKLLNTHNMPVYYASYRLLKDRLTSFEFGFEYP